MLEGAPGDCQADAVREVQAGSQRGVRGGAQAGAGPPLLPRGVRGLQGRGPGGPLHRHGGEVRGARVRRVCGGEIVKG